MKFRSGLFALALGAACTNGVGPLRGDIYVLNSIAGVSLPAPYTISLSATGKIIADTLALDGNGTGMRRTVYEGGNGPTDVHSEQTAFTYTKLAGRVEIWFACPPNADCIAGPHLAGMLTDASFTVDTSVSTRVPLVFARLFPPD